YAYASALWSKWAWLPRPLRRAGSHLVEMLLNAPGRSWDRALQAAMARFNVARPIDKLGRLSSYLAAESPDDLNRLAISRWENPACLIVDGLQRRNSLWPDEREPELSEIHDRLQLLDLVTYLPDDILAKVDRATMAVSLEARVPLLDHRVIEFAWRL